MACTIMDILSASGGRRVAALLGGPGDRYVYLTHVGTGWGFARLRLRPWRRLSRQDPLLGWLAWDGWGFHRGFFSPKRAVGQQRTEPGLGAARSIRDQGLGRSLWFHDCAQVAVIAKRVGDFPRHRQRDLWSGVGLAAGYAGGVSDDDLARLAALAGPGRRHLVQGVAFAAKAHLRGGCLPAHTRRAAAVIAEAPAEVAAAWTDEARAGLSGARISDYQAWRARIRGSWDRSRAGPVR